MTRISLLLLVLLGSIFSLQAGAQYYRPENRVWALGNLVGLDFNPALPTPFRSSLNATEGSATVSDSTGKLLFYTNGGTVWNRTGNAMPRGVDFTKAGASFTLSTTQGAVIVPVPDAAGKYYIFSLSSVSNCKLYCTKIDMSLDGGMGDVDTTFSLGRTRLDSNLTEKMIAVPGCNNNVWLLVRSDTGSLFKAYEINGRGINLTPVISYAGQYPADYYRQGVMKVSSDGKKIMTCNFRTSAPTKAGLEVYDFDQATGRISKAQLIDSFSYYGGNFSPDNSKIYATSTVIMNSGSVYQFDLDAPDPMLTKTLLGPCGQYTDMKAGPDGKLYFGALVSSAGFSNYMYMGRINEPDQPGSACNFQDSVSAIRLPTAAGTAGALSQGLPNEVVIPARDTTFSRALDTAICPQFVALTLEAPAYATGYVWDNGRAGDQRDVTAPGVYWVAYYAPCLTIDSFFIHKDFPEWGITVDEHTLATTHSFDSYQWYKGGDLISGATAATYTVAENGVYSVKVTLNNCSDSLAYNVTNVTKLEDVPGLSADIRVYPNPSSSRVNIQSRVPVSVTLRGMDGRMILQRNNVDHINIRDLSAGIYMLELSDKTGNIRVIKKIVRGLE